MQREDERNLDSRFNDEKGDARFVDGGFAKLNKWLIKLCGEKIIIFIGPVADLKFRGRGVNFFISNIYALKSPFC